MVQRAFAAVSLWLSTHWRASTLNALSRPIGGLTCLAAGEMTKMRYARVCDSTFNADGLVIPCRPGIYTGRRRLGICKINFS